MTKTRLLALLAGALFLVTACSSYGASPTTVGGAASNPPAGIVVGSAPSPAFGTVLTGPNGLTLYTYARDTATESTCTGSCAAAWPPLAATGQLMAGAGVTGRLGTLTRPDGTTQVTYDGRPLYYWEGDTKAGDVTGDGIDGFSVATVGGAGAKAPASQAPTAPSSGGAYSY
jgi:predicted lipoprotein with Yx(FWY)xxD motif